MNAEEFDRETERIRGGALSADEIRELTAPDFWHKMLLGALRSRVLRRRRLRGGAQPAESDYRPLPRPYYDADGRRVVLDVNTLDEDP